MTKTSTDNFPLLGPTLSALRTSRGRPSLLCWDDYLSHASQRYSFLGCVILVIFFSTGLQARSLSRSTVMDISTLSRLPDPLIKIRLRTTGHGEQLTGKWSVCLYWCDLPTIFISFKFSLTILSLLSLASSAAVFFSVFFVRSGLSFRLATFPGTSHFLSQLSDQ